MILVISFLSEIFLPVQVIVTISPLWTITSRTCERYDEKAGQRIIMDDFTRPVSNRFVTVFASPFVTAPTDRNGIKAING